MTHSPIVARTRCKWLPRPCLYNKAALTCSAGADSASKHVFEELVQDEEGHFAQFETQRDNIKHFGPNYLALQSFGGKMPEASVKSEE